MLDQDIKINKMMYLNFIQAVYDSENTITEPKKMDTQQSESLSEEEADETGAHFKQSEILSEEMF